MPQAALHTVGGRLWDGAWDADVINQLSRPVRPVRCRGYKISNRGRPRQSQVPVFLMLVRLLHSQATVGWEASHAETAQPVKHDQHDRRETPPCVGGPDGPGGVESSISTLLSP
jgi:hypothetical protein